MFSKPYDKKGFSIIELIVVVGVFSLIVGISFTSFKEIQKRNSLVLAEESVTQALRRAQTLAVSGSYDSEWGVFMEIGKVTVFQGNDYSARDESFDKVFSVANTVSFSGVTEVWFSKLEGEAQSTGTITLNQDGVNRVLTLNQQGVIMY